MPESRTPEPRLPGDITGEGSGWTFRKRPRRCCRGVSPWIQAKCSSDVSVSTVDSALYQPWCWLQRRLKESLAMRLTGTTNSHPDGVRGIATRHPCLEARVTDQRLCLSKRPWLKTCREDAQFLRERVRCVRWLSDVQVSISS